MGFILLFDFLLKKKRNGFGQESAQCGSAITTAVVATQRTSKRTKTANPTPAGHAKVRFRYTNNIRFHLSFSHTQLQCMSLIE